ncbi:asparagine-rich protein-like [Palaemon carinicauda]|uniref:asparagine-rich protein-like n=1 Tax=Palaemon carinicauda TaxID=392227 RepID=UPI0035B699D4
MGYNNVINDNDDQFEIKNNKTKISKDNYNVISTNGFLLNSVMQNSNDNYTKEKKEEEVGIVQEKEELHDDKMDDEIFINENSSDDQKTEKYFDKEICCGDNEKNNNDNNTSYIIENSKTFISYKRGGEATYNDFSNDTEKKENEKEFNDHASQKNSFSDDKTPITIEFDHDNANFIIKDNYTSRETRFSEDNTTTINNNEYEDDEIKEDSDDDEVFINDDSDNANYIIKDNYTSRETNLFLG